MKITDKAITEHLGSWIAGVNLAEDAELSFSGLRSLVNGENELKSDILYIWPESVKSVDLKGSAEGVCFLMTREQYELNPGIRNVILLRNDCSTTDALNSLLALFNAGSRFTDALQDSIISAGGLEGIFEVAKEFFPDCLIIMTDMAYNIIHATKNSVDDGYLHSILEQGFYSKKDVDMIASRGYFEDWQRTVKPMRYTADMTVSGKSMLLRSYQRAGFATEFVTCYFLSGSPTEFDYLMFKQLTDCIESVIRTIPRSSAEVTSDEQLVADLLNAANQNNETLLHDRCMRLGLPYNIYYRVGVIQSNSGNESRAANIAKQLRNYCSIRNFGIFKFHTKVIIVFGDWNYYSVKERSSLEDNWRAFTKSLQVTGSKIGISLGFSSMDGFFTAYQQAERAFSSAAGLADADELVYFYSRWYLADILSEYEKVMDLDSVCVSQLLRLNDGKHNEYDNMTVLYEYLRAERNIAITARRLNMHRNGVVYRINKILDQLQLDLDDADMRLRVLISYEILKKEGKFKPAINAEAADAPAGPLNIKSD